MIKNPSTYEIMTPQSVGAPGTLWCWASTLAATPCGCAAKKLGFTV